MADGSDGARRFPVDLFEVADKDPEVPAGRHTRIAVEAWKTTTAASRVAWLASGPV